MNKETKKKLLKPFPKEVVMDPPKGKFGKYVNHAVYVERLRDCDVKYDWKFEPIIINDKVIGGKGTITIEGMGSYDGAGDVESAALNRATLGECLKLAESDAFKRACMRFGLGVELWSGTDDFYADDNKQEPIKKTGTVKDVVIEQEDKALAKANSSSASGHRSSTAGSRLGTAGHDEMHAMSEHIQQLQDELRNALKAGDDIRLLKAKLENLVDRARKDKERYLQAKSGEDFAKKKMDMLRDHLEKLMTHLKHEATAKVRVQEQLRVQERELFKVQEQKAVIQRKSNAKDRLVLELREGSKILEDQLRLMDEKYLELRVKLDWARENGDKKVKKAQQQAKELRMKFTMLAGGTSIDKISLPSLGQMGGSTSMFDPSMAEGGGSYAELGGSESLAFANGNMTPSQTPGNRSKSKNSKMGKHGMSRSQSMAEGSIASSGPPTMDKVMEKIRKHAGGKTEWTEEQMRDLVKSR